MKKLDRAQKGEMFQKSPKNETETSKNPLPVKTKKKTKYVPNN